MITPISLESEIEVTKRQLEQVKEIGAERFHIDIIDGLYADNLTVAPADLQALDLGRMAVDLHLLVDDPVEWIPECAALKPTRIFAQIERMGNIEDYIERLREQGKIKIGLALDITTPIESLRSQVLSQIDGVLLMSVKAGYSGQEFDKRVLPRIKELRKRWRGWIVIDGGINPETYRQVMEAGASEAGANSALWRGDFEENFKKFMQVEGKWQRK